MKTLIATIVPQILDLLTPVLFAAFGWACLRMAGFIKAHTRNAKVQGGLLRLNDAVWTAVGALEQTTVVAAKEAASDGQLTKADGAAVKASALAEIKSHLGPKGIAELKAILGIESATLDSFLSSRIEAAVLQLPVKSQVEPATLKVPMVQGQLEQNPGSVSVPVSSTEAETPLLPIRPSRPKIPTP